MKMNEALRKTALVVGANGVIGRNLIEYLEQLPDWDIIGVSRRGGDSTAAAELRYVAVDLLNERDTHEKLGTLTKSPIFFTLLIKIALLGRNWFPQTWLCSSMSSMQSSQSLHALQHISLMQGYKVYGAHLGPFKTPARETDAYHMPPEFNVDQQQFLEQRQRGSSWTWSALRPSVVCGFALGNPMNLAMVIAIYASISKELGLPLRFPGKPGAYNSLLEMTDAGLLAKATVWAATDERCANQAFNITNGDLFRWNELWPKIAASFGLETAPPLQMSSGVVMADKEELWKTMVEKHGLVNNAYKDVSSWGFGDFVFSWDYDFFADGTKARRFGFHEFIDTEAMFLNIFEDLRQRKVIP